MRAREQVDGSAGPGVAMLLMATCAPEGDPQQMWERLVESETMPDPHAAAYRLRDSVKGDWPDHEFAVVVNPRAHYLMWKYRMEALLGPEHGTIEAYLQDEPEDDD